MPESAPAFCAPSRCKVQHALTGLMHTEVAALVVTYFPDGGLAERLARLRDQVGEILIVDNSDEDGAAARVGALADDKVRVISNGKNLGIARALNRGVAALEEAGFSWVVMFDQDSSVNAGFVDAQIDYLTSHPDSGSIAIVGARRRDRGMDREILYLRAEPGFLPRRSPCQSLGPEGTTHVITSGSLTRVSALRDVGGFRDDYFIDMVDIELCLRLRQAGWKIVVACDALMEHEVGSKRLARLGPVKVAPTHHSAQRRYYLARNSVATMKQRLPGRIDWRVYHMLALGEVIAGVIFFEKDKRRKLRAIWAGLMDGWAGEMGRCRRDL